MFLCVCVSVQVITYHSNNAGHKALLCALAFVNMTWPEQLNFLVKIARQQWAEAATVCGQTRAENGLAPIKVA